MLFGTQYANIVNSAKKMKNAEDIIGVMLWI